MYRGYTGSYPPIQVYHGGADTTLYPQNYYETVKQWVGVWGYNYNSPQSTQANSPASGWTRTIYGPGVQGIFNKGVTHNVPIFGDEDMKWFGFTQKDAPSPVPSSGTTPPVAQWGQCGGSGFAGSTVCASPSKCVAVNQYYSQCQ